MSRRSYREDIEPTVFFPVAQSCVEDLFLIVRGPSNPMAALPGMRSALAKLDAAAVLDAPQTLAGFVDSVLSQERLVPWCLDLLAGIALVLSVVGLYGVSEYSVEQRTVEVGIRGAGKPSK